MFLKEVGLRPDLKALKIETAPREWGREFQMVGPEKDCLPSDVML